MRRDSLRFRTRICYMFLKFPSNFRKNLIVTLYTIHIVKKIALHQFFIKLI